jgi:glycosyltransferase involved in cell wall biosynthesis
VPFTVGMVGRIASWKGQDVLLRAFASAFAGGSEQLHLIGSAMFGEQEFEREIHTLARDLGIEQQVTWRGFQDDVRAQLSRLDVLVHCSITAEPFGQVVVEGMLAGLAVIAAADGGPVEIIDNGRDGVLVRPGDVEALTAALRLLADNPTLRRRMGSAAARSAQRFDPRVAAAGLDALYAGMSAQRRL